MRSPSVLLRLEAPLCHKNTVFGQKVNSKKALKFKLNRHILIGMTKIGVKIQLKPEVLDTSGRAILKALQAEKLPVAGCFSGKYIVLLIKESDREKALAVAERAARGMLHNDLTETFQLEALPRES